MALSGARALFAVFACGTLLFAQDFRATVTGQITDPSGSGVANGKVTIENLQTNESSSQTTNEQGNYTIPFLIPGNYKLTAVACRMTR